MAAARQTGTADSYDAMLLEFGARTRRRQLLAELRDLDERFPGLAQEEGGVEPTRGKRYTKREPGTNGHKSHMKGISARLADRWAARGTPKKKQSPPAAAPDAPTPDTEDIPQITVPADATISKAILHVLQTTGRQPAAKLTQILMASGWSNTESKRKGWLQLVGVTLARMKKVNKTVKHYDNGEWEINGAGRTVLAPAAS